MEVQILWTLAAGTVASFASLMALRTSGALKRKEGRQSWPLTMFWGTVSAYMICFTLLRLTHALGLGGEVAWFHVQTVAGASTLIALMYILFAILIGPNGARWAAEGAAMIALVTVFMIFWDGVEGPYTDAWSVELIPVNAFARAAVGLFYVVTPVAMSVVVAVATRSADVNFQRRTRMFGASVILMYVPNAGKYVAVVDGPEAAGLAVAMAIGALLGWRSYVTPGGNG